MDKSDTPTLLVPLLALLAILFPFAVSVRSPSPPAEGTLQAKQRTKEEGRATRTELPTHSAASLIEDFLHAHSDRETSWPLRDPRSNYSLDFMIATVPDPVDLRLPYFFDSFLDSIQRAFEADGYVLDRFHLAWSEPPPKTAETEAARQPDNTPRYRWRPSLLLFRKPATDTDQADRKLLLVFLIAKGEVEKLAPNWIAATDKGRQRLTAWNGFKAKIRGLSPAQFDRFMHAVLDTFGFEDVTVTWQTGDGGFDGSGTLRRGGGVVRAAFKCRRERPAPLDVEEFRAAIGEDFETGIMSSAADGYWPLALAAAVLGEGRPIVLLNADAVLHLMEREAKTQRIPAQPYEAFWTIILESALCGKPS